MRRYLDLYLFQPQIGRTPQNQIRVRIVNSARYLINDSASRIVMDDNVILSNRNEFEVGIMSRHSWTLLSVLTRLSLRGNLHLKRSFFPSSSTSSHILRTTHLSTFKHSRHDKKIRSC